ncbi:hypothetical protein [Pseudoxanthomonas mexicana]
MNLSKELSWMSMEYITERVMNLALHECIALNDRIGVLAALDHGANPKSVVQFRHEREGVSGIERCRRTGDADLMEVLMAQGGAE